MSHFPVRTDRSWQVTALFFVSSCVIAAGIASCGSWSIGTGARGNIIDHESTTTDGLSVTDIAIAKASLNIVYWHTSHGSQLVDGMAGMDDFYQGEGLYAIGGADAPSGVLRLVEQGADLGNPVDPPWHETTRAYLEQYPDVNVVVWSWCGQVSGSTEESIAEYLAQMTQLELDYPGVRFVYMTGHADGTGLTGNLHLRNTQIREYCVANEKFLYDFYDIECYDPDGNYYGDRNVTDGCAYDGGNWALEWQAANPDGWWQCGSAHSEPLNANQKAKAAWNLWVALARSL